MCSIPNPHTHAQGGTEKKFYKRKNAVDLHLLRQFQGHRYILCKDMRRFAAKPPLAQVVQACTQHAKDT